MKENLLNFKNQIIEACQIGKELKSIDLSNCNKILFLGMGGSSIAGELLKNFTNNLTNNGLEIIINRDYEIPMFIDDSWLVIVSSYSGNTEETISAYEKAKNHSKYIVFVTSGGYLKETANNQKIYLINLPTGYQPRAAIAFSFFTILYFLMLNGFFESQKVKEISISINNIISKIESLILTYSDWNEKNRAYKLSKLINDKIPYFISSDKISAINLRFRGQIQENSKTFAFGSFLPEMNHNEINSFSDSNTIDFCFIILKSRVENQRIIKRIEFLENYFIKNNLSYQIVNIESEDFLFELIEGIILADWTSYWLAINKNENPDEIKIILELKEFMSN